VSVVEEVNSDFSCSYSAMVKVWVGQADQEQINLNEINSANLVNLVSFHYTEKKN